MLEKTLKKVNENLYLEPYKDNTDLKWFKRPEFLTIYLRDIGVIYSCSVERPEFPLNKEYEEKQNYYITAKGSLQSRVIRLITEEGKQEGHFDQVEVSLKPIENEDSKAAYGYALYIGDDMLKYEDRDDPYITLELYLPRNFLEKSRIEIEKEKFKRVILSVYIEVFQSEVERSLAEPYMRQYYFIEKDGAANTYFHSLAIENPSESSNQPNLIEDEEIEYDDEEETQEPSDPLSEIKELVSLQVTTLAKINNQIASIKYVFIIFFILFLLVFLL